MAAFTSDEIDQTERDLLARLGQIYGDKMWIVAGEIAQGVAGGVLTAKALGATDAIAIASRLGVGELPDQVRFILSDDSRVGEDASMIDRMHDSNRELHDLPAWVIAEVDEWDPHRQAQVIAAFTVDAGLVAIRPTFGARLPAWAALEDKIAIRDLWRRAEIPTAPDRVVRIDDLEALLLAHDELASRLGTVWAADNEQGWHGGGVGTHWVADVSAATALAQRLSGQHQSIRVQPFLEGVPCSIHGMVLSDATLAFRPCEMIMMLDVERHQFVYSRAATFWDPSAGDRETMRATVRAIGDQLREMVDFRGVFTLDGVLTPDGFRPTEVNPRFGAALPPRLPTADGNTLQLFFTHLAAVTGNLDDFDPELLEALIVTRLDANRSGGAFVWTTIAPPGEGTTVAITGEWNDDRFTDLRAVDPGDAQNEPFVEVTWGPDPNGGMLFAIFTSAMVSGPPVAATVAEIRRFLNDHWNLGLQELRPAFSE